MVLARDDLVKGNARHHGRVLGYDLSGEAHHATAPNQDGVGAANAMNAVEKRFLKRSSHYITATKSA